LYGPSATADTYQALVRRAGSRLEMGDSVIVDASFREQSWRERFLDLAAGEGATPLLVEVYASPQVVAERLARREAAKKSASDGRRELVAAQAASWQDVGPQAAEHLLRVDGGAGAEAKMTMLIASLEALGYIPEKDFEE
ncbi:MAG: ATP-binding protein, partial [Desulfarculaceae bacterium]|nr:ATP-binding protein [Desulfarculaceae bacterium]